MVSSLRAGAPLPVRLRLGLQRQATSRMRYRTLKRMLVALGKEPFTPTDEMRELVRLFALNGMPHERIASHLDLELIELRFHFRRELELSNDAILADAARNILELASQREDLGVAYRANEMILKTRLKVWREPKQAEEAQLHKKVENMSLEEVEAEIERLERVQARASASEGDDTPGPGKPH